MKRNERKKPKCPECISPELQPYYDVGLMKACYVRYKAEFMRIGYVCTKHYYFEKGPGKKCIQFYPGPG